MPNDSITYALTGEISKEVFAAAAQDLSALIDALAAEIVGKDRPQWIVEYLEAGSATMTFVGVGEEVEEAIEKIVRGYAAVGRSLERGEPVPYSKKVESAARRLTEVLDGAVTAVRFETPEEGELPWASFDVFRSLSLSRSRPLSLSLSVESVKVSRVAPAYTWPSTPAASITRQASSRPCGRATSRSSFIRAYGSKTLP